MRSGSHLLPNVVSRRLLDHWPVRPSLVLLLGCVLLASAQAQSVKPVLILLGPPASGKSTQAALIQKQYGFAMITREQLM